MAYHRSILFLTLAATALSAQPDKNDSSSAVRPDYLPGIRSFLDGFAKSESKHDVSYFFVTPPISKEGRAYAYAYWMNDNSIIILDLPVERMDPPYNYSRYSGKARIDLATDVVPTSDDIGGSTYLVSADWVQNILRNALQSEIQVVVRKQPANPTTTLPGKHAAPRDP